MSFKKEQLKIYLDTKLLKLLQEFSNSNKVSIEQGLEMITRIFLSDDDVVDVMVSNHHLDTSVEEIKEEVQQLKNSNHISICAIEKLREQIAEIQEQVEHLTALA